MVQLDQEESTQCAVYDLTPNTEQRKISIVIRPNYTISKVIGDITTQYPYERFDLVLQPILKSDDLVYLNDCKDTLIYKVSGFQPSMRNVLILLPSGKWDGNVKKRFSLFLKSVDSINGSVDGISESNGTTNSSSNCNINSNINSTINSNSKSNSNSNGANNNSNSNCKDTGNEKIAANNSTDRHNSHRSRVLEHSNSGSNTGYRLMPATSNEAAAAMMNAMLPIAHSPPTPTQSNSGPASTADSLNLSPCSDPEPLSDDDLALGASASPTETEPMNVEALSLAHASPNTNTPTRSKFGALSEEALYQHVCTRVPPSAAIEEDFDLRPSSEKCRKTARVAALTLPAPSIGSGYVGLVNQAMTCYLNSLLQALFMTPEFRNALYRWEFDNDNEAKNIPYQLQKLFLNLQTSKKSAVETTYLTRSFGWDSTEAWQQHDIQELCRVMFDALEHKFRNTKQANLISTLYEGKMIDYVKCLDCQTEKARIDTFLDIPLPVRPFGSTVAYGSIEEALRAFVQPETLDGNNQYFCEKCNKKCDAHKGLKFKSFPYILTLHLKRFDFDYQTMHRIKLNDKVTFPHALNLNTFISATERQGTQLNGTAAATTGTTDDCSTTDSGSAMEEDNCSSGVVTTASSSQHENDMNDEDEGIDMSTSTDHRISTRESVEQCLKHESGPYLYELFAIMIHSGSASGGHYYAYIKEFSNNEWFCFNDQSVTPITEDDIQKSFGGASTKGYYSISTNAYMLMYRQIDPKRNEHVMKVNEFPPHINTLMPQLNAEDEIRTTTRVNRYGGFSDLALPELIKPRVYFYNPDFKKLKVTRVYVSRTFDVNSVLESAYSILNVEKYAPLSLCRLVGYDATSEEILQSFENVSDPSLSEIRESCDGTTLDFLLEYRVEGQEFEIYSPGGATWFVYVVNLATMEMDGPNLVHSSAHECGPELRRSIAIRLHVNECEMLLAALPSKKAFVAYDPHPTKEAEQNLQSIAKAQFRYLTYFYMYVPKTDPCYLEVMGIPAFEQQQQSQIKTPTSNPISISITTTIPTTTTNPIPIRTPSAIDMTHSGCDVVDAVLMNGTNSNGNGNGNGNGGSASSAQCVTAAADSTTSSGYGLYASSVDSRRGSPLPPSNASGVGISTHESNSEDSSLSDGDRTLVESVQNRGADSLLSSNSSGRSPQLSSPEEEAAQEFNSRISAYLNRTGSSGDAREAITSLANQNASMASQFFHAIELTSFESTTQDTTTRDSLAPCAAPGDAQDDLSRKQAFKILVDSHMKMGVFKRHIESLIRVPANYFKIQRKHGPSETVNIDPLLVFFSEGETLMIELGKALEQNEHKSKIFFMRLADLDNDTGKLPCICEWIYNSTMNVTEAKKDLIAKLHRIDAKYETLNMNNCRLWLKGGRNPIKILRDDESLTNEVRTSLVYDFLVQECDDGVNPQPSDDSLTLFVRQWHADTLQLDKFQEITLEKDTEIKNTLSKLSGIPEEQIEFSKINSPFPCTTISLLSVNKSMTWFSNATTMDKYPLSTTINGNVFFYKDNAKQEKELSIEERREFNSKEKSRLDQLGCVSTSIYSPRRERALKIYVDSPTSPGPGPMDTGNCNNSTVQVHNSSDIARTGDGLQRK